MTEGIQEQIDQAETKNKCTCNSGEFITEVCPIHGVPKSSLTGTMGYDKGMTTITDGYLLSEHMMNIQAFVFQCPACQITSVLVNTQFIPKYCANCGVGVEVKSKVFTDSVRNQR